MPGEGPECIHLATHWYMNHSWASLVAQLVENLPAMWETWVQSLGWQAIPSFNHTKERYTGTPGDFPHLNPPLWLIMPPRPLHFQKVLTLTPYVCTGHSSFQRAVTGAMSLGLYKVPWPDSS